MTIQSLTVAAGQFPQELRVRAHRFTSDVGPDAGGDDSAPDPHDLFDAALAACKSTTAIWYAKRNGLALERADTVVERDASLERKGSYKLTVRMVYHGALSREDRERIHAAVTKCPIHKLMATTEITIETEPLSG